MEVIFDRSLIDKNESMVRNHFRQHPVLMLDFGFCSGDSCPKMREPMKMASLEMGEPYTYAHHNRDS